MSSATPSDPSPSAYGSTDSRDLATQQRDRFGGMKFGACFLGWTTAVGITVVLTSLVGLVVALSGVTAGVTPRPCRRPCRWATSGRSG